MFPADDAALKLAKRLQDASTSAGVSRAEIHLGRAGGWRRYGKQRFRVVDSGGVYVFHRSEVLVSMQDKREGFRSCFKIPKTGRLFIGSGTFRSRMIPLLGSAFLGNAGL